MTVEELISKYKEEIEEALTDLKTPGQRHKQIPNILTFCRLLSPAAIIPTALSGNSKAAAGLAALFGLTDLADGFIARNWHLSSQLGADLDALTDKVFVATLLLTGSINNPYLLVNTGLEGIIAGINLKEKVSNNSPSSTIMGKIKTGAIFALGGVGVISNNQEIVLPIAIATTVLQSMTIASYIKKYDTKKQPSKEELPTENNLINELKEERKFLLEELQNEQANVPLEENPSISEEKPLQKVKSPKK